MLDLSTSPLRPQEYATAARLPDAWSWTKAKKLCGPSRHRQATFGRVKTSLTESLQRQGCMNSDDENEAGVERRWPRASRHSASRPRPPLLQNAGAATRPKS